MSAEWPSNMFTSPSKVESKVSESHFGIYLELAHFPVKIGLFGGEGGGGEIFPFMKENMMMKPNKISLNIIKEDDCYAPCNSLTAQYGTL